jgi:hypothetical protein
MRANRAMGMLAMVMTGTVVSTRAEAAGTINPDIRRRLVVSIPDRKLAVIENDQVVQVRISSASSSVRPGDVVELSQGVS